MHWTLCARNRGKTRLGWGPKAPRSPRQKSASASRRRASWMAAASARWLLYTPPKTAIRSYVALLAGSIGAQGPVLVAGETGLMTQCEGTLRLGERVAKPGVLRFDQDRADEHAPVRDDAAMVADEQPLV